MTLARKTLAAISAIILFTLTLSTFSLAQGTRTWEQSKFDELTKGTAKGIALRSEGGLELAPAFKALATTPSTYIWSITADAAGNVYAAAGSPARVYRITPDGQSTTIFEPQELQVQALVVDKSGTVYAATGDRGEIFKVSADGKHSLFFKSDEVHIRVLALDPKGTLIAVSDGSGLIYRIAPNGDAFVLYSTPKKEITALAID